MFQNYKKFWFLLTNKNQINLSLLFVLSIIASMAEVLSLGTIIAFLSTVLDPDRFQNTFFYLEIKDFFGNPSVDLMRIYLVTLLIFIFLGKNLYLSFFSWAQILFVNNLRVELAKSLYSSYLNLPYDFHLNNNSTILYRNVDYETLNVSSAALKFITIILEVLVFISLTTFLLIYQFEITVAVFIF